MYIYIINMFDHAGLAKDKNDGEKKPGRAVCDMPIYLIRFD